MGKAVKSIGNVIASPVRVAGSVLQGDLKGAINNTGIGQTAKHFGINLAGGGASPSGAPQGGYNYNSGESMLSIADRYRPDFESARDPQGNVRSQYQLQAGADVNADQRSVNAIRDRGLSAGPSAWAQMATQENNANLTNQLNSSAKQNASATAQGMNNLAMRGGISSGSRERMMKSGANNLMMAGQEARNQSNMNQFKIGMQDDQQKMDALRTTSGLDFQNAALAQDNRNYLTGIQQKNIGTALADMEQKRTSDMDIYRTRMASIGAERTGNAQAAAAAAGGKGKK